MRAMLAAYGDLYAGLCRRKAGLAVTA
jgi:hypothetical protein